MIMLMMIILSKILGIMYTIVSVQSNTYKLYA